MVSPLEVVDDLTLQTAIATKINSKLMMGNQRYHQYIKDFVIEILHISICPHRERDKDKSFHQHNKRRLGVRERERNAHINGFLCKEENIFAPILRESCTQCSLVKKKTLEVGVIGRQYSKDFQENQVKS